MVIHHTNKNAKLVRFRWNRIRIFYEIHDTHTELVYHFLFIICRWVGGSCSSLLLQIVEKMRSWRWNRVRENCGRIWITVPVQRPQEWNRTPDWPYCKMFRLLYKITKCDLRFEWKLFHRMNIIYTTSYNIKNNTEEVNSPRCVSNILFWNVYEAFHLNRDCNVHCLCKH